MYIIKESAIVSTPTKVKPVKDKVRMEVVLQTVNEINRNRRFYSMSVLKESVDKVMDRIKEGSFLGELDHPIDSNPARQVTVWYKSASHKIRDLGWEGNKLVAVIETLSATSNGRALRDLVVKDEVPVGFSYRGMGDLQQVKESSGEYFKVLGPLNTVTWDSVSHPSHAEARLVRVTESSYNGIKEDAIKILTENCKYEEVNGMICTKEGICYLPNAFDRLVEKRVINITNKFKF